MSKKTKILKEMGWDDALIKHFMVEDSECAEQSQSALKVKVLDSDSLTIKYNAIASGTSNVFIVKGK